MNRTIIMIIGITIAVIAMAIMLYKVMQVLE